MDPQQKKGEQREFYFSKIFGYMAFANSGRLNEFDSDLIKRVLNDLIDISNKKSYFAEISFLTMCNWLDHVSLHEFSYLHIFKKKLNFFLNTFI